MLRQKINKSDSTRVILTKESPDRDGEIVLISGLSLDNYNKNPVFLWAHNDKELPLGKIDNIVVESQEGVKCLVGDIVWSEAHEKAQQVKQLFDEGALRAVSIQFLFSDYIRLSDNNPYNAPEGTVVITKSELLEVSAVPIPANAEALAIAKSKGLDLFSDNEIGRLQAVVTKMDTDTMDRFQSLESRIAELENLLITSLSDLRTEFQTKLDNLTLEIDKDTELLELLDGSSGDKPVEDTDVDEMFETLLN